ncbi:hypothetical protein ACOQFL_04430 [Actinopolyspora sp. H202]|uniref:hypothetical protein n=1 Tax=Actinopolyspora sp. H202 TaxID=1500456 RepID=UPI003EE5A2CC
MTEATEIRYVEPGSSWWPLLWGPGFALLGLVVELTTPGPLHLPHWPVLAVLLAAAAVPWIRARRRFHSVTLTTVELTVGGESLPLDRLVLPEAEPATRAARVLGESSTVPKGKTEVPLLLRHRAESDTTAGTGTVVLAWARFPEALRAELAPLLRSE